MFTFMIRFGRAAEAILVVFEGKENRVRTAGSFEVRRVETPADLLLGCLS